MSADNGIYILNCRDGYRVTHETSIENITWKPDETGFNTESIKSYFGKSKVYKTLDWVRLEAKRLLKEILIYGAPVEYGICEIEYPFVFPTD